MVRLTFPNPFGPPITLDTALFPATSRLPPLPVSIPVLSSRRGPLRFLPLLLALALLVLVWAPSPPFPPAFKDEWNREWALRGTVGFGEAEAVGGRYIAFDVPKASGFNHQLQRVLLQHHLAVLSNRSLAFEPFVQDETWLPFEPLRWPWRAASVPLSAFISTPISGFEAFSNSPRAISDRRFRKVCPRFRTRIYRVKTDLEPTGELDLLPDGQSRIHQLQVMLAGSEVGCIRIEGEVFSDAFFDSQAPLQLYESFIQSPVMRHMAFSPLIYAILNRHLAKLAPEATPYGLSPMAVSDQPPRTSMWRHVLALHLRRGGNWEEVCVQKAQAAAPFAGFNKLPRHPGNENIPPPSSMVEPSRLGLYRAKCLPEVLDIIDRARRMRKNHPLLRSVYIMSDADPRWINEVSMWLQSESWDHVWVGGRDIWGGSMLEREVGVGVDMEVARRAGVFIGNGFSTTSSDIVLLRARDGIHPDLTQFW